MIYAALRRVPAIYQIQISDHDNKYLYSYTDKVTYICNCMIVYNAKIFKLHINVNNNDL